MGLTLEEATGAGARLSSLSSRRCRTERQGMARFAGKRRAALDRGAGPPRRWTVSVAHVPPRAAARRAGKHRQMVFGRHRYRGPEERGRGAAAKRGRSSPKPNANCASRWTRSRRSPGGPAPMVMCSTSTSAGSTTPARRPSRFGAGGGNLCVHPDDLERLVEIGNAVCGLRHADRRRGAPAALRRRRIAGSCSGRRRRAMKPARLSHGTERSPTSRIESAPRGAESEGAVEAERELQLTIDTSRSLVGTLRGRRQA